MVDSTREISVYKRFLKLPIPKEYRRLVSLCSSEKQKTIVGEAYEKLIGNCTTNGYHGIMILDSVLSLGKTLVTIKIFWEESTIPQEELCG